MTRQNSAVVSVSFGSGRMLLLGALTAFGPLAIDLYLPALPTIAKSLGAAQQAVEFSVTVYLAGFALGMLIYGPVADRYGRRPVILAGITAFAIASLVCAATSTIPTLIAARFVQALGGGAASVLARAVVQDVFQPPESMRKMATLGLISAVAPLVAPLSGSAILAAFGWRGAFVFLSAYALVCGIVTFRQLPETRRLAARVSPGGIGSAFFAYRTLCLDKRALSLTLVSAFAMMPLFAYITNGSFYFIELHGFSPFQYSVVFAANGLGIILASYLNTILVTRFSAHGVIGSCLVAVGIGATLIVFAHFTGDSAPLTIVGLFLVVSMVGPIIANCAGLLLSHFPHNAGSASAFLGASQFGFGMIASSLMGGLHDGTSRPLIIVVAAGAAAASAAFGANRFWARQASKRRTEKAALPRMLRAFEHRPFRYYFAGQFLSMLGTWVQQVALSWLVYRLTGSAVLLGISSFCSLAPQLLIGPLAGAFVDRHEKRPLALLTQSLLAVQAAVLAVLVHFDLLGARGIIAMSLLTGFLSSFDMPLRQTLISGYVRNPEDRINALALNTMLFNCARLLGPPIAGFFIASTSETTCFLFNAFSNFGLLLVLSLIAAPEQPRASGAVRLVLKQGLALAWKDWALRAQIMILMVFNLATAAYAVLLPIFVKEIFTGGGVLFGWLWGAVGAGGLVGTIILTLLRSPVQLIGAAIIGMPTSAAAMLIFPSTDNANIALAMMFALGAGIATCNASINIVMQSIAPEAFRGRIVALFISTRFGFDALGGLFAGSMAASVGAAKTMRLNGLILAIFSVVLAVAARQLFGAIRAGYCATTADATVTAKQEDGYE